MIPEIGHFSLILALSLAICQSILPLVGVYREDRPLMVTARTISFGQLLFVSISFACLILAFTNDDFSVLYVANNSQLSLPIAYKVSAVWSAHEGSLLMWILILAIWTAAVSRFTSKIPLKFISKVIAILGFLSVGFLLFILLTSNPFERLIPAAIDGADLNPLLQDPGLVIHPPILYIGYVGFSVAFAFAIAAMLGGNLDQQWARWTKPWTTLSWLFLTIGIALGSWWAYYELGWGGWWFWDPVENASFMPWLVGTALIHSLSVTERRGLFKSWTLLLAISAFSLSLLGTFLVRSGIIVSVHAFATDPTRGYFILSFLGLVVIGALILYAWRAPGLDSNVGFSFLSRETFLLLNNVLLVIATILILFGTLAPLFFEILNGEKISIGAPWFEIAFLVPMIPLIILLGLGMHTAWRKQNTKPWIKLLKPPFIFSIIIGILLPLMFYGRSSLLLVVGCGSAIWIIISSLIQPLRSLKRAEGKTGITRSALGMSIAHLGMGIFVIGVTITSAFGIESDRAMRIGETSEVAGLQFEFRELRDVQGPNYVAIEGVLDIRDKGKFIGTVRPQKRQYLVQKDLMTEAGIHPTWNKDLFVALGEKIGDNTWSVRIQYKPMIRFIWIGAFVMAIGGLISVTDRRYRKVTS